MRLASARSRMGHYLHEHGARATILRKIGEAWEAVAADVPVMVTMGQPGPAAIDPQMATSDQSQSPRLSFPHGTDVQIGDRVELTATEGSVPTILTVSAEAYSSLNVTRDVTASVEETAVETYIVTIQRFSDEEEAYIDVLEAPAQVVTTAVGERELTEQGATATRREGTLIFRPVPEEPVSPGDWILGVPWAAGAVVTQVRPVVGDRLELTFRYALGG